MSERDKRMTRRPGSRIGRLLVSYLGITILIGLLLVGVLFVWWEWAYNTEAYAPSPDAEAQDALLDRAAKWGGAFGGFNALFAALGFLGVIFTLLVQSRALFLQHEEVHRDRFDNLFFRLVEQFRSVRSELRFRFSDDLMDHDRKLDRTDGETDAELRKMAHGKKAVLYAVRELRFWAQELSPDPAKEGPYDEDELRGYYEKYFHNRFESDFSPYFRTALAILQRIEADPVLTTSEKIGYAVTFRDLLESHDLFLIGMRAGVFPDDGLGQLMLDYKFFRGMEQGRRTGMIKVFFEEPDFSDRYIGEAASGELPQSDDQKGQQESAARPRRSLLDWCVDILRQ